MTAAAQKPKTKAGAEEAEDWFDTLDEELERKTVEVLQDTREQNQRRVEINRSLIQDFWRMWKRFAKVNAHFTLEPNHTIFAHYKDPGLEEWDWKAGFDPALVSTIQLVDKTYNQGRIGDSLKVNYYARDGRTYLRVTFEYCEGEHYYKYSGWKRIFAQHLLYEEDVEKADLPRIHNVFKDVVKAWYESHLRRNRELVIRHLKQNYEKVETFTQ